MAKFTRMMLDGERPTINGDGEQSRDFTYIANVVQANLLAASAPAAKVSGRVFNVATGSRITLNQLYKELQKLTGFKAEAAHGPDRPGDVKLSLADITAAREALGYDPLVSFEDGLRKTVEWYKKSVQVGTR
jgi:UDP-glucose 4-epimerase